MDEIDLDKAIDEIEQEYKRQYKDKLPGLTEGGLKDLDALRIARLAGVLIKREFSHEHSLDTSAPITGAWFGYELQFETIKKGGPDHVHFLNSWQAKVFASLDTSGDPLFVAEGILSEKDTILRVARATRKLICNRQNQLRETLSLGAIPTGAAIAIDTAAIKAGATWLATNIPLLSFVTPGVLIAFTIFLIGFGLARFCDSIKLSELLDCQNREE